MSVVKFSYSDEVEKFFSDLLDWEEVEIYTVVIKKTKEKFQDIVEKEIKEKLLDWIEKNKNVLEYDPAFANEGLLMKKI